MRRKEVIQFSGAYFGVIIGAAITQFVLQGKVEHIINKLIFVLIGYIVVIVANKLKVLFGKQQ